MAKYSTVSLMMATLPAIGSRTNINSADYNAQLLRAESIIDSRLAKKYYLPVTPECATGATCNVPILQTIATDLSLYRLMTQRLFTQEKRSDSMWPDKFKEAMDLLNKIATGELELVTDAGAIISERTDLVGVYHSNGDYLPTMTEDDPIYQHVDPEKIEAIRDERDLGA